MATQCEYIKYQDHTATLNMLKDGEFYVSHVLQ